MKKINLLLLFIVCTSVCFGQSKLYWIEAGANPRIVRAEPDGSNPVIMVNTGLQEPCAIALDEAGGKMYWTDYGTDKIQRANLDGSDVEDLVDVLGNPYGIALDLPNGKIYWTDWVGSFISRSNLDGSNYENVIWIGISAPRGIAVDTINGKIYWIDSGSQSIKKANLDGSNVQTILPKITGYFEPYFDAIAISSGADSIYIGSVNEMWVYEGNLTKCGDTLTSFGYTQFLALSPIAGQIYFAVPFDNMIYKATMNGFYLNIVPLSSIPEPRGIAVAGNFTGVNPVHGTASNITIYPNPTSGEVRITSAEVRTEKIIVVDIFGRSVMELVPRTSEIVLDLSHLRSGLYLVHVHTGAGTVTRKLVKR